MQAPKFQQNQTTSLTREQRIDHQSQDLDLVQYNKHMTSEHNESFESFFKSNPKAKSIALLAFSIFIVIILYWLWSQSSTQLSIDSNNINYSLLSSTINGQINQNQGVQDSEYAFGMSFVETQYEGKQTQESLARASFTLLQKKFNLALMSGFQVDQLQKKKLLEDISSLDVMIPDESIEDYVAQNFYFFSASIRDMIMNSHLYLIYRDGHTLFKISLKQHMRAIIRTQLVHSVNFKGEINPELSPFDKGIEQKQKAIRQIMDDEELYYESFYQLSKYNHHQLRFCILVPSYKNVKSRLYLRNLDSIFMQDYQNYHVVYIDDASPDLTGEYVKRYVEERQIPSNKIQVFINDVNKKAMYNIYNGIHSYCPDGEVVGIIDGDDSLLGRKVLQLYNAVYQQKRTSMIYSNFLKILTNNMTSFGFGTELSFRQLKAGKLRNSMQLMGTHFMTFFSDLFKMIKKEDLCYENGTFYDYAYDRAIITPMIEMAYPRVQYLAQITYEYRNDTGMNDGTDDWERVSKTILKNKPYKQINNFSFIDDFVEETERLRKVAQVKKDKALDKPFIDDFQQEENQKLQKQTPAKQLAKK